ncbi:hypothetical protein GS535_03535 [Saccharibacter sp. EH611]|uniref:DUF7146 domain-containing protein n=1 Tax=unclassified Saccharibacter TaxID=2648722 RepID=UPI001322FAF0|nr:MULTISPECIES: toprim domain-containing protein [unclassified Saccharibacter]MXV35629.1 hypothetical protein [Saccharibacter sp. EH611]MXV65759.1 hypothetical protein [Saccharibacter sp. EH60]
MSSTLSASEVASGLGARTFELVRELLPAGKKNGPEWCCGSVAGEPGKSLSVRLTGPKAGVWSDFAAGQSGDALDLVAAVLFSDDRKQAYRWGLAWLGYERAAPKGQRQAPPPAQVSEEDERLLVKRMDKARVRFKSALPLQSNDPVLSYLAGRKIILPDGIMPPALRFHPELYCHEKGRGLPAMVAAFTTEKGRVAAIHQTWLEQKTQGWVKASLDRPKKMLGPMAGHMIPLWKGSSDTRLSECSPEEEIVIGEGIETCLSIVCSCPQWRVICAGSLGNMAKITLPPSVKRVLLLRDNDTNYASVAAFKRAEKAWLERGVRVRVACAPKGKDFNDTLRGADGA